MVKKSPKREMRAAAPASLPPESDHYPTIECAAAPPSVPFDEPPPSNKERELEARIDRLLLENLSLMRERKQLLEVADQRAARANACLAHARHARGLMRAYVKACSEAAHLADSTLEVLTPEDIIELSRADEAYAALMAFLEKPL